MTIENYAKVRIMGDYFDAISFQNTLPENLKGEVGEYRLWTQEMPKGRRYFWNSKSHIEKQTIDDLGERWCHILDSLEGYILPFSNDSKIKISCSMYVKYSDAESVNGFWFSRETLKVLSKYNAEIDIDAYCYSE